MDEDLKKILEESLALNKENNKMLKSIKRHFIWQKVISFIYIALIVGPIIWGLIYLPPLLKPIWSQYQELMNLPATGSIDIKDVNNILKNINLNDLKK